MEIFKAILGGAAGAAFITGVFSLIKWCLERKAKKADRKEERSTDDIRKIEARVSETQDTVDNLVIAMRMQMYDRIKHLAKSYIDRGYITVEELEDLDKMHDVYHGPLQGNGFLSELMEQVHHLPLRAK